jgi:hypothetical protein
MISQEGITILKPLDAGRNGILSAASIECVWKEGLGNVYVEAMN